MSPNNNNQRRSLGNIINRVFESAGPDGKVRGTPQQIIDKYQALARDAQLAGDRVAAESFLQHSEHYSRMLGEAQSQQNEQRQSFERDDARDEARGDARGDGRRDEGRREDQRRDDQRRDDPRAEPGRRDEGGREDGARVEGFDQPRPPRPDRALQPTVPSGLAMIDPEEDGEIGGLIDTPESGAAAPRPDPGPGASDVGPNGANGAPHAAAGAPEAEAAEPPKRGRPRRKAPRPDGQTSPAQAD